MPENPFAAAVVRLYETLASSTEQDLPETRKALDEMGDFMLWAGAMEGVAVVVNKLARMGYSKEKIVAQLELAQERMAAQMEAERKQRKKMPENS